MRAFMSDSTAVPAAIIAAGARPVDRYTIASRSVAERKRIAAELAEREARAILAESEARAILAESEAETKRSFHGRLYLGPGSLLPARRALAEALAAWLEEE